MDRREFLKGMVGVGGAGLGILLGGGRGAFAQEAAKASPDLVAVKGGDLVAMLDRAMKEFGGMGSFVRKGQTVVVKPNIGWDRPPEAAANTNPLLVRRIVEHCLDAGARKVWVFDHSCDVGARCYASSQIERYARDAGAEVVSGESSARYQEVVVPGALTLKKTRVHELILDADVFINVPVLKDHSGAGMTCAMKNLMGIVWDRETFHRSGLDQCIADSCLFRKPALNIVDAYKVMRSGGPRGYAGSRYDEQKMLIASTDILAADMAAAKALGGGPDTYRYLARGAERGVGRADLSKLDLRRISM